MAIKLTFKKAEKALYSQDIVLGDYSEKINFVLSDTERHIFIHADWIDAEFQKSTEESVAETLCGKINKDLCREAVTWSKNFIKTTCPHTYFKVSKLDNSIRIEIFERTANVGIV